VLAISMTKRGYFVVQRDRAVVGVVMTVSKIHRAQR
jgi:hypothetical protein